MVGEIRYKGFFDPRLGRSHWHKTPRSLHDFAEIRNATAARNDFEVYRVAIFVWDNILPTTVSWKPRITALGSKFDIVDVFQGSWKTESQMMPREKDSSPRS